MNPLRHTLNKRIELARDESGRLCVYCEVHDKVTHEGIDLFCCTWSKNMMWSYVYGRLGKKFFPEEKVA